MGRLIGAGDGIPVLLKSSKCSLLLSHVSSLEIVGLLWTHVQLSLAMETGRATPLPYSVFVYYVLLIWDMRAAYTF